MLAALACTLAVFTSAESADSALGGGFGVNPMAMTAITGALASAAEEPTFEESPLLSLFD